MPPVSETSVADLANGAAGLIVVMSGAFAGVARSFAILRGVSAEEVDSATAIGFLVGAGMAAFLLGVDIVWE